MKFTKREKSTDDSPRGEYLKLKDGESKIGVLRGEIAEVYIRWGDGPKEIVEPGAPGAKLKFRANFFVREGERLVPKIWEFGTTIYNQLADLAEEYDVTTTPIKVTRTGSSKDSTKYTVLPLLKTPLTPKQLAQLDATPLHILAKDMAESAADYPPGWDKDDAGPELEF